MPSMYYDDACADASLAPLSFFTSITPYHALIRTNILYEYDNTYTAFLFSASLVSVEVRVAGLPEAWYC